MLWVCNLSLQGHWACGGGGGRRVAGGGNALPGGGVPVTPGKAAGWAIGGLRK